MDIETNELGWEKIRETAGIKATLIPAKFIILLYGYMKK